MSSNTPSSSQPSGNPPSLFGTAATTNTSGSSNLFGQNQSSTASPFGSVGGNTSNSPFGAPAGGFGSLSRNNSASGFGQGPISSTSSTGFSFPAAKSDENKQPASAPSLFGSVTPNKPSLFGASPSTSSNAFGTFGSTAQPPSGAATPTTTQAPSLFGNNGSTTPMGPPPAKPGGLFGNLGQPAKSGPSLFGVPETSARKDLQAGTTSTPFGSKPQTPNTSQPTSASLFGAPQSSSNLFGGQTNTSSTSNLFGKPSAEIKSPEATATSTSAPQPSPFGFPKTSEQTTANTSSTVQAQTDTSKPDQSATGKASFSFPAFNPPASKTADTPATATTTPSLFAPPTSTTPASSSSNLFGAPQAKENQSTATCSQVPSLFANLSQKSDPKSSAPPSTNLFGSLGGAKKDSTAGSTAPASNLFAGLGQKRDASDAAEKPQSTNTATESASATVAPTSTSTPSLFSGGATQKTAETTKTSQPGATAASAANTAALGSSTAGPAPSAQSRLKNKSMDEIITRWASDLSKYQKEFQSQAEKVASWDRMLLENGNAISKLYSKTFQAERDISEVEKQLTAVEGNQEELSQWLDRYERDVDEMIAWQVGQGEGLQGPDQERERTYRTAERVSERLTEMSKDLTTMIEEINEASSSISKTSKADDPLSQIVRILNGHLSQLQLIDQSTASLQAKVTVAQKESKKLGTRGQNLSGSDAIDDFYRSYMSSG